MRIEGGCHCGGIRYALDWPGEAKEIRARACGCAFCVKHGGVWTSHPAAVLAVTVPEAARVSQYRFGTKTADFHVCSRCGAVPFVTSEIEGRLYAVVNVNTFEGIDPSSVARAPASFEGEGTGDRLERRKRNWIASVSTRTCAGSPTSSPRTATLPRRRISSGGRSRGRSAATIRAPRLRSRSERS